MKKMFIAALMGALALPALAVDAPQGMTTYAQEQLLKVVANPAVIAAIHAQNAETADLSEADILALDQTWRDETEAAERPMISATLANEVSVLMADLASNSGGMLTEVFVMDARGLNVGQSGVTSDYWQGDEAKFTKTYPMGAGAVHVSDVELDESTQTYQGQVSMSIVDPDTGEPIGAVTFGIDATSFF